MELLAIILMLFSIIVAAGFLSFIVFTIPDVLGSMDDSVKALAAMRRAEDDLKLANSLSDGYVNKAREVSSLNEEIKNQKKIIKVNVRKILKLPYAPINFLFAGIELFKKIVALFRIAMDKNEKEEK